MRFLFDIEFEFKAVSSLFFQFNWEKKNKKNFVEWNELGNTKSRIKELRNFHTHTLRANAENTTESIKTAYIRPIYSHTLLYIQSPLETIEKRKNCTKTRFLKQRFREAIKKNTLTLVKQFKYIKFSFGSLFTIYYLNYNYF